MNTNIIDVIFNHADSIAKSFGEASDKANNVYDRLMSVLYESAGIWEMTDGDKAIEKPKNVNGLLDFKSKFCLMYYRMMTLMVEKKANGDYARWGDGRVTLNNINNTITNEYERYLS